MLRFKGAKGGSGGSQPTLTPDNLRSTDTVEIILGLCEGKIKGLANGLSSFYVGDTQLQSDSGQWNFNAFETTFLPGDANPPLVIPRLGGNSNNQGVNVQLRQGTTVTRDTTTGQLDYIDIRLVVQALYKSTSSGTFENSVQFKIEYKPISAFEWANYTDGSYPQSQFPTANTPWDGFIEALRQQQQQQGTPSDGIVTISGKTTSSYVRELRIPVPRISEPYNIRITKLTAENTTDTFASVTWESYQEIDATPRAYPNLAVMQIVAEATDQFTSIPDMWGIYDGLCELKIPSNYDPDARTYTGVWDGTFKLGYTNNPALFLYNFVTNTEWGMSRYYPVNMDKYDIYEAAQWCDDMVPDGAGGLQPRYTFNYLIQEPRTGIEMARYIAGTFNAAFFDDNNGTAFLKVDKDDPAVHLFTPENVVDGIFNYSFSDMTGRYNDITVTFNNSELSRYAEDRRRVFDQAQIDKYGRIPFDFIAVGCTNEHEAIRRAMYKLITATTEVTSVNFQTNRQGHYVQPFDVILVADPDAGFALSGRVSSVGDGRTSIVLRDPLYLEAGVAYKITFQLPDGLFQANLVGAAAGNNYILSLDAALPANLPEKAVFEVEQDGAGIGAPKPFRVMKVDEVQGNPDLFEITAVEINRNKWTGADNATPVGTVDYTFQASLGTCSPPGTVQATSEVVLTADGLQVNLNLQWDASPDKLVRRYQVWYSRDNGPWMLAVDTRELSAVIEDVPHGHYDIEVIAENIGSTKSAPSVTAIDVGDASPIELARVTGLELFGQGPDTNFTGRDARFTWRTNAVLSTNFISDTALPAGYGFLDPTFDCYVVRLYDATTNDLIREETTKLNEYIYTFEKNAHDSGGPRRQFRIEVGIRDRYNQLSKFSKLTVQNPAPAQLTGLVVDPSFRAIYVDYNQPPETDWQGVIAWMSTASGFTPDDSTKIFDGSNNKLALAASSGTTYYLRFAAYDVFGKSDLNISPEMTVTTSKIGIDDLANQIIDSSKLAQDLSQTIDGNSTGVQELQTTTDGLSAQYVVKVDVNGYAAGFGLASTAPDGGGQPFSEFIVRADRFAVINPGGGTPVVPFIVQDGTVYMDGAVIADATIGTAKISDLTADKITSGTISAQDIYLGSTNFHLDGVNRAIVVQDSQGVPQVRVKLGKLGAGTADYGIEIFDAAGNLMLGSAGFGNDVIPSSAVASLDYAKVTGAGAMGAIDQITAANISTYIAGAAIGTAQIGDATITTAKIGDGQITTAKIADAQITNAKIANLDAGKITTGTLSADYITANTVRTNHLIANAVTYSNAQYAAAVTSDVISQWVLLAQVYVDNTQGGLVAIWASVSYFLDQFGLTTKYMIQAGGATIWSSAYTAYGSGSSLAVNITHSPGQTGVYYSLYGWQNSSNGNNPVTWYDTAMTCIATKR